MLVGNGEMPAHLVDKSLLLPDPTTKKEPASQADPAAAAIHSPASKMGPTQRTQMMKQKALKIREQKQREAAKAAEAGPSTEQLAAKLREILDGRDLATMSLREVRYDLNDRFGLPTGTLEARKPEIDKLTIAEVDRIRANAKGPETPEKAPREPGRRKRRRQSGPTPRRARAPSPSSSSNEDGGQSQADEGAPDTARGEFVGRAQPLVVQVGGNTLKLAAKRFRSGGCGFFGLERVRVEVDGVEREAIVQINCAVLGSREWAE
jgi:hypothetical protein